MTKSSSDSNLRAIISKIAYLPDFLTSELVNFDTFSFILIHGSSKTCKNMFILSSKHMNWHFLLFGTFQNRTKSGNLGKIVRFAIRTKPGIVLIEFVLSGELLYCFWKMGNFETNEYFWMKFSDIGTGSPRIVRIRLVRSPV